MNRSARAQPLFVRRLNLKPSKEMLIAPLPEKARHHYAAQPETGMGFQQLEHIPSSVAHEGNSAFVLNGEFLLVKRIGSGSNPVHETGFRRIVPAYRDLGEMLADPSTQSLTAPSELFGDGYPDVIPGVPDLLSSPPNSPPDHPPYQLFTRSGEQFVRVSPYTNDWRILPDGSVKAWTYATTPEDLAAVPSGLAAVGRYALPNPLPACYVYQIIPPPGTSVFYGTVTPNYGLCGGGVEVQFPDGCPSGSARLLKAITLY